MAVNISFAPLSKWKGFLRLFKKKKVHDMGMSFSSKISCHAVGQKGSICDGSSLLKTPDLAWKFSPVDL